MSPALKAGALTGHDMGTLKALGLQPPHSAPIDQMREVLRAAGAWMSVPGLRSRLREPRISARTYLELLATLVDQGEAVIERGLVRWAGQGACPLPTPADVGHDQDDSPAAPRPAGRGTARGRVGRFQIRKRTAEQIRTAIVDALRDGPLIANALCQRARLGPMPYAKYTRQLQREGLIDREATPRGRFFLITSETGHDG